MFSSCILSLASVLVATALSSIAAPALKPGTTIIQRQYNETLAKRDTGFNYGGSDVRGVNLGGWLVLGTVSCVPLIDDTRLTDCLSYEQSPSLRLGCSRTSMAALSMNTPFVRTRIEVPPRMPCGAIGGLLDIRFVAKIRLTLTCSVAQGFMDHRRRLPSNPGCWSQ